MRLFSFPLALMMAPLLCAGAAKAAPPPSCAEDWNAGTVYHGGDQVSEYGVNYTANYYTQGNDPETNSGYAGAPWTMANICHACEVAPTKPTQLTAVATSDTQTDLIWSQSTVPANCQVTRYQVFQGRTKIGISTGNNFPVSGLTPATRYKFIVRAFDSVGPSDRSDALAVRTQAAGQGRGPTPVFAPYVDMNQATSEELPRIMSKTGMTHATLAFLITPSSGGCNAAWGGTLPFNRDTLANGRTIRSLVNQIRRNGGDVIISFGGSAGTDVALSCNSVASLRKVYQQVINYYRATALDFDIEGSTSKDQPSLDRRAQALFGIRKANPNLTISYTLAVLQSGLDATGLNVLTSAKALRFEPDVVNIMAMDYGNNEPDMGQAAVSAANNTALQIEQNGMTARVGVTPMIGVNDSNVPPNTNEVFGFADANTVLNFAQPNPDIARLAMWSLNRDNGSCAGRTSADPSCSGLKQRAYRFIDTLKAFGQ